METKTCTKCYQIKELSAFPTEKGRKIARCRLCVNAQKAEYKRRKRAEFRQQEIDSGKIILPIDPTNNQICPYCQIERPTTEFRHNRQKCKNCERLDGKAYRQSDIGKQKSQQWVENNRDQMTKLQAEWYQQNKEKRNEEYRHRYHSDPTFKFKQLCKRRILMAFKSQELQKAKQTVDYLNCSIHWLIEWLKFCFSSEMTLENHGKYWHIDHVIPINKFDLTDSWQIYFCFSWFNLSPMIGSENMSKHDTLNNEQIQKHVQKLVDFLFLWDHQSVIIDSFHKELYIDLCARHLRMSGNPLELCLPLP